MQNDEMKCNRQVHGRVSVGVGGGLVVVWGKLGTRGRAALSLDAPITA